MSDTPNFQRDERGLVVGVTYRFTPDGRVDYRAMVDPKFLYIVSEKEDQVVREQGVPLAQVDLSKVREEWLRIRLGGINQLAGLRGYTSLEYPVFLSREGNATAVCRMNFIPNYETGMQPLICSATASACRASMDRKMLPYLETFAENRAFSRCVKRALQINILSDIEVGGDGREAATDEDDKTAEAAGSAPTGFEPLHRLQELCRKHKPEITFPVLKEAAAKYQAELKGNVAEWTSWSDIQALDAWVIVGRILAAQKKAK